MENTKNTSLRKVHVLIGLFLLCGLVGGVLVYVMYVTKNKEVSSNIQKDGDTTSAIFLNDNQQDLGDYLTSIKKVDPVSEEVIGVEIYTHGIVPYFHNQARIKMTERERVVIPYSDGIEMDQISYNSESNKISIGDFIELAPKDIVRMEDVNFDGHDDIGVLSGIGYGGVNLYYTYYRAQPSRSSDGGMEYILDPLLDPVSNPSIDEKEKTITSSYRSGPQWYSQVWQFQNGQFVAKEEVVI